MVRFFLCLWRIYTCFVFFLPAGVGCLEGAGFVVGLRAFSANSFFDVVDVE
jgi:hypothetical protein